MATTIFSELLKKLRIGRGYTLREFCSEHGFDPGNHSRLERGMVQPPHSDELLEKYANALGLLPDTEEWREFFDSASAARGEIPKDLLNDPELVANLPVLFRTLRGDHVPPKKLDKLLKLLRSSRSPPTK